MEHKKRKKRRKREEKEEEEEEEEDVNLFPIMARINERFAFLERQAKQ